MTLHDPDSLGDRLLGDVAVMTDAVARVVTRRLAITAPADQAVRSMIETLVLGVVNGEDAVLERRARRDAANLARVGSAQQTVVELNTLAMALVTAQVWRRGRTGDHAALTAFTHRATDVLDAVQRIVADTYWTQARADRFGRHERRSFAHALLAGQAVTVEAAGLVPAERYRAVVLRSEDDTGVWRARASENLHEQQVLHCVLAHEIVAFVPEGPTPGALAVGERAGVGRVAVGTSGPEPVANLPVAVSDARLVARLALTVPLLDTVVSADQLRLELTLLNNDSLAASMRDVAAPILMRPDLLHTIRVLYQLDLNRTSAARRLGIARRTLTGRLTRIEELTGLNPTSTRGIQILHTALTAMSMRDDVRAAPGA